MKIPVLSPETHHATCARDGAGHLGAGAAADVEAASKERAEPAPFHDKALETDSLAQELGEAFVRSATGGEDDAESLDESVSEAAGGPFVETTKETEFAYDTDASNPAHATREPFPTT